MFKLIGLRTFAVVFGVVAVFASVGLAASFTINDDEDIINAEGETLIKSCTDDVTVEKRDKWEDPRSEINDPLDGGFFVDEIKISGYGHECRGEKYTLVLTGLRSAADENVPGDEDGWLIGCEEGFLSHGGFTLVDVDSVPVKFLNDLHVLIGDHACPSP